MEFWSVNFCCSTGDIGLDVYYDKVITQAAGYSLFEYISAVQRNLVSRCNVVIQTNWEGYTQSCQFFDCSLFVFFCFFCIQTDHSLAIIFWQAHFLSYQFCIISTIGCIDQALHSIEVIFTVHWINCVNSLIVICQVQTVVDCFSEVFICNSGIPVGIRSSVFFVLAVVKVNLVGIFIYRFFYQIIIKFVICIAADGLQVTFCQVNVVNLACLIKLECNVVGFYHFNGNSVEQAAFCIPVSRILGKYFFVALYIGSHGVATVIPHCLVVHFLNTFDTQLINHCLGHWIQTSIGCNCVKIWFWSGAMINNGVIIRCFDSNHFTELGAFTSSQCLSFFC